MLTPAAPASPVDTTTSPAPTPTPPIVTPPRTETNRSRNHVGTLASSPAESLWTAPTGKRSRESSIGPERLVFAPEITFETPSSGPTASLREDVSIDANTYYTASWGSPYQRPSRDSSSGPSAHLVAELARDRPLDSDSPTASPPFGLDYLLPSRVARHSRDVTPSFGLEHLIPSRVSVQPHISNPVNSDRLALQSDQSSSSSQNLKPAPVRHQVTRSLTEDWVHQYTSGRWRSERGNWLSDESAGSGSDTSSENSEDFKTPIPFTWFSGRHRRRKSTSVDSPELNSIGIRPSSKRSNTDGPVDTFAFRKHKSRGSNLTLKQEDFWKFAKSADSKPEDIMSIFESRWAAEPRKNIFEKNDRAEDADDSLEEGEIPYTPDPAEEETPTAESFLSQATLRPAELDQPLRVEKPLPPTPPEQDETIEETNVAQEAEDAPPPPISKSATPPPAQPRQRTRLVWNGKACWIGLPGSGPESYGRVKPLSAAEAASRIRQFEEAGYNTNGFDVEDHWAGSAISQSKGVFPDPTEDAAQRQKGDFMVRVPNMKAWKERMEAQIEAKLAALGVSLGDEPAPAPPSLSRRASEQYPARDFSPNNIAASMAGGSHRSTPSLAHFSTAGHSHSASIASPISMPGMPGHLHRHSVFGMPYGFPQQQTGHSGLPAFSPGQQFNISGVTRGGSPALERLRTDSVGPNKSPILPFGQPSPLGMSRSPKPFPQDMTQIPPHLRHQSVYSSFSPQPQPSVTPSFRPPQALPELREDEEEQAQDYFSGATHEQEIAQPSPRGRGHRHNISEGLERDIQEAEYHLERSIERQMDDESAASDSFNSSARSHPVPAHDKHAYVPPAKRGILSMNGLAEHAPPAQIQHQLQSQMDGTAGAGFAPPLQNKLLGKAKGHASKLSVAAPEFKFNPGGGSAPVQNSFAAPQNVFVPPQQNVLSPLQNSFAPQHSFPTPAFGHARNQSSGDNPSAPPFQPTGFGGFGGASLPSSGFDFSSSHSQLPALPQQLPQSQLPTIFGNVTIPEVSKPARRSKAIVIKAPVIPEAPEKEEKEDENGRVLQSEDRQKRARTQRTDGDDVPLFAERPPDPPQHKELPVRDVPEELRLGDNTTPEDETAPAVPAKKDVQPSAPLTSANLEHGRTSSQNGHKKNTSSLSALAKPFEFKTGNNSMFAPQDSIRTRSPGALQDKPDFSPARVFSRNLGSPNHKAVESLSFNTSPEPQKHTPYPEDESTNVHYPEPTFDEIDAVMQQLNDEDSEHSPTFPSQIVREGTPIFDSSVLHHAIPKHLRSDAPSPSPRRAEYDTRVPSGKASPLPEDFTEDRFDMPSGPSIQRLNRDDDVPLSEWSDDLDVTADRIQTRSRFFDDRIDAIVGNIMQDQLRPLEQTLQLVHRAVSSKMSRERSRPATVRAGSVIVDSDADDEDELPTDKLQYRPMSSGRDKRAAEQVKAAVLEAFSIQEMNTVHKSPGMSSAVEIHHALMDMNTTIARIAGANLDLDDVRAVVDDALHRHSYAVVPVATTQQNPEAERNHKRAITELEGRFNETLAGRLEEANQRRMTEEREADTRRLLRLAEEELSLLRETTSDQDHRINSLQREFQTSLGRAEEAEQAKRNLEKQLSDTEAENAAFESTLEEYRLSSNKWRQEVDDLNSENESLKSTVNELKAQIADGLNIRENMRGKLDRIHADMAGAAEQLANEKSAWQTRNEELQKKSILLQARLEGETSVRRSLEEELQSLRSQVHDGVAAKIHLEQALRSNAANEDLVNTLKTDLAAEQTLVARIERDLHEAKESGRTEVQRTQMIMESSIEAANGQSSIIRSSLEHELHLAQNEIDNLKMTIDTSKARQEMLLEEEADLRRDALRKVNETSSASLNDLREKHQESLRYMRLQHERDLTNALEDKQRTESYLQDRLNLSNDQVSHLQDRVSHLEERLQVARSAAQAAVKQAQAAKYAAPAQTPAPAAPISTTGAPRNLDSPEKISPQALRESILVLQEQLQERETRIESLQSQISQLDTSAPAKLKERDTEITWLRELLAVRNEDLSELIRQLEQEGFDREAVRDYAIRISAGIQMEQAEKERLISAGTSKAAQAVAGLVNVATPGAARLASAWGNWRKGRSESVASTASTTTAPPTASKSAKGSILGKAPARANVQVSRSGKAATKNATAASAATPSKPAVSPNSSLFAGLMTPPASNLRRTPTPDTSSALPAIAAAAQRAAPEASVPGWQQGNIHPGFTHTAPPGFGPRRTSPLSQENTEVESQGPGLFSEGYDSDAELGAGLPDENFEEQAVTRDDVENAEWRRLPNEEAANESDSGDSAIGHDGQRYRDDEDYGEDREEGEMGIAEETLGRSLAAELESL